tara:strand:+ start:1024 stop:2073 length:1050 start_codon:yes stop_codon:yes gene_type:complete
MKYILLGLILCFSTTVNAQDNFKKSLKKCFRFSTFYGAVNGGNSISDVDVYSVSNGLQTSTIRTPYDYNVAVGVRKIARFGYENRAAFYDGNEKSWSDGANVGKVSGLEFLFELDYKRQQGQNYLNQHHFIRYVGDKYIFKGEYLEDGFANIKYFETSERYRHKVGNKLSFNVGAAQRLSEPYGYDPLDQWVLPNGDVHYTYLAIQEGYTIDFENNEYKDPNGNVVATSPEIWTAVVVPEILKDYTEKERGNLNLLLQHSVVIGFDFYHYKKDFWLHAWGNVMPYHYNSGNEYSYHKYNNNKQWYDYAGGLIFGYKFNKNLGTFVEGKYNKYWNREWYNFKLGINYIIF